MGDMYLERPVTGSTREGCHQGAAQKNEGRLNATHVYHQGRVQVSGDQGRVQVSGDQGRVQVSGVQGRVQV
jgi:hypothetical protein